MEGNAKLCAGQGTGSSTRSRAGAPKTPGTRHCASTQASNPLPFFVLPPFARPLPLPLPTAPRFGHS
eukprot:10539978-Lingulodinium_polyedra.AAC.1